MKRFSIFALLATLVLGSAVSFAGNQAAGGNMREMKVAQAAENANTSRGQFGKGKRGEGMRREHKNMKQQGLIAQLNLSDEQKQQIDKIVDDFDAKMNPLLQELRTIRREMNQKTQDSTKAQELQKKIAELQKQLDDLRAQKRAAIEGVLTPEQKEIHKKFPQGPKYDGAWKK